MGSIVGIPLIVVSRSDDHANITNNVLRESGHPVHCTRVNSLSALDEATARGACELVLFFGGETDCDFAAVAALLAQRQPPPPLLLVSTRIDESAIAAAMESGARDVVSLTHRGRLQAVVTRELRAHRLKVALNGVMSSAHQYKQELRSLMTGASEAICDVLDGIIVATNPAWGELFGVTADADLVGQPFMDLYQEADQATLKGALVACLRGKWREDQALGACAYRTDASQLRLEMHLKKVTIDGEPGVRVIVPADRTPNRNPVEILEQAVAKDPSTGFLHRHHFLEQLTARIARPPDAGIRVLAYLRPDHFARVQDDVGLIGTEALIMRLADILRELSQQADIYGRFGGTMLTVLLERGTLSDAQAWAEQVRKTVANQVFEVDNHSTSMTCTIGLCEVRTSEQTAAELLTEAEQACRTGRVAGGNRTSLSENSSATEKRRQTDSLWTPRLRAALMQNRLRLVHQPVVGLHEEVHGVLDTRVRLIDEQGEPVSPGEFIPAAERAGMMKNIDRWVIGASFSFCAARHPNLVFVRLSRDSVLDDSLVEWLRARAGATRLRPAQVCFQVSEELAVQQLKRTKNLAATLVGDGFQFAIDHLGTGRDSLQLLDHVPMQFMKIDGSLMQGLHRDKDLQKKVGDIAKRASELGIKSIAERVENANTMAALWQLGVAFVQGNFTQQHGVVLAVEGVGGQHAAR